MLTRYGFTSVFDLSSNWENTRALRDRIESGEVPGPRIRSTGQGLVSTGALPPEAVTRTMGVMKYAIPEVADGAPAEAAVRALLDSGVDGIKLFLRAMPPEPQFSEGTLRDAVAQAHARGKRVFVHPTTGADVLAAIRAGVDVVAHTTPQSGPWDESALAELNERRTALTPTLTIWQSALRHDRLSTQEQAVTTALGQMRAWGRSGAVVLFGNDLAAVDYDPAPEYMLMAEAGMRFPEILASLTTAPAELFGESDRLGRIVAGMQADLAILNGDPSNDIRALTAVEYTLRDGHVIYRARH
jgi:imidazolonepropionase-like amidohydrolase